MKNHEVITSNNGDYCFKICRCHRCGCEEECTPNFDFYKSKTEKDEQGRELLLCERCLMMEHFGTAYPPTQIIHPDGTTEEIN